MAILPKQVEQDLKEIEAYEKQLAAEQAPAAAPTEEQKPEVQAPSAPEVKPETQPKPVAVAAPEVKPEAEQHDAAYWKQRFQTVQGMYDAEKRNMLVQIQTMQEQIASLQKPAAATPELERLVSQKDVEEYGVELIDVQRRVAQEVFREHVAPLQKELQKRDAEIAKLAQALNRTDGAVTTMSFEQRLALAVPNFNQINADPAWIAYLDEPDPYTGEPRRAFAEFAYNNGLVEKVKQVVTHFQSTRGQQPDTKTAEETERAQRQAELERQITPTRTNSQPSTAPTANTRIYTEREMVTGFDQVRRLNAANKYDEAAKLEAELSLAYMENRVRG